MDNTETERLTAHAGSYRCCTIGARTRESARFWDLLTRSSVERSVIRPTPGRQTRPGGDGGEGRHLPARSRGERVALALSRCPATQRLGVQTYVAQGAAFTIVTPSLRRVQPLGCLL